MKTSVMRIWLPLLLMAALSAPSFAARLIGMNDNTGEFYEIDPSVPSASFLGDASTDVSLSGLAYDSANGRLWVSDTCGDNCFGLGWVDMNTWQITEIGGFVSTSNIHALAYDWDQNILFGWDIENNQLVSLDRGTGEETYLGDPSGPAIVGMTYDPIGRRLLGASRSDQRLYSIHRPTQSPISAHLAQTPAVCLDWPGSRIRTACTWARIAVTYTK